MYNHCLMFVIFLDIDGVLISAPDLRAAQNGVKDPVRINGMFIGRNNRSALLALNDPDSELYIPSLHVVVHSTWRVDSQGLMDPRFFNEAFEEEFVDDVAPCPPPGKIEAIQQWREEQKTDRFVVLDDHLKLSNDTPHIRVPSQSGFTREHAKFVSDFARNKTPHTKGPFNLVENRGAVRPMQTEANKVTKKTEA